MKTKHTPAPWKVEPEPNDGCCHECAVRSEERDEIWLAKYHIADIANEKDASLIVSAPELLEACKYVVKWHKEHDSGEGELFGLDFVTTCINAINKAEGV